MEVDQTHREKASQKLHKNATSYIRQLLEASPPGNDSSMFTDFYKHTSKTKKTCQALLEKQRWTHKLSKFLRQSLLIFIIKGFWTSVFIFIVISTTFCLICPPAFFMCLLSKFLRRRLLIFIFKCFSDYCLCLYCYFYYVSADMSSGLLQVFVELGKLQGRQ